jgi:hypothetical protein
VRSKRRKVLFFVIFQLFIEPSSRLSHYPTDSGMSLTIRLNIKKILEKCPFKCDSIYKHIRSSTINWNDWQRVKFFFHRIPYPFLRCTILWNWEYIDIVLVRSEKEERKTRECRCEKSFTESSWRPEQIWVFNERNPSFSPHFHEFIQLFKHEVIETLTRFRQTYKKCPFFKYELDVNVSKDILRMFSTKWKYLKSAWKELSTKLCDMCNGENFT